MPYDQRDVDLLLRAAQHQHGRSKVLRGLLKEGEAVNPSISILILRIDKVSM